MIDHELKEIEKKSNGIKYKVLIKIPMEYGFIDNVSFNVHKNNYDRHFEIKHSHNDDKFCYFESEVFLHNSCLYHYDFTYKINNTIYNYKPKESKKSVNRSCPQWAQDAVIYHIYVDRYKKGRKEPLKPIKGRIIHTDLNEDIIFDPDNIKNNDFYGGDIEGIIQDLDYLESLGVTILYLSPIVLSQSNHRYDTADYEQIDPYAGTHEDLRRLCDEAHKRGMHVILDAVFNHTGNDSKYFNEFGNYDELGAFQSEKSIYFPYFKREFNKETGEFEFKYWWGLKNLPVCDGSYKEWQDYIYGEGGIIDSWMALGIDGLRLDVADDLSDMFLKGIFDRVLYNKSDAYILGEVWEDPMKMNRNYMDFMHSVMNYNLIDPLLKYYKYNEKDYLISKMNEINNEYPDYAIFSAMNFTSTHDISRIINLLATDEFSREYGAWAWDPKIKNRSYEKNYKISQSDYKRGREIYKSYLLTLAFMAGNLSLFYGDEAGIQGLGNICNRKYFIKENTDYEIYNYAKWLIGKKKEQKAIRGKKAVPIDANDKYLMYERKGKDAAYLIAANKSQDYAKLYIPDEYRNSAEILTTNGSNVNELTPFGGIVLKKTFY